MKTRNEYGPRKTKTTTSVTKASCKKVNFPHECREWDFSYISPGDPEFDFCKCLTTDKDMDKAIKTVKKSVDKKMDKLVAMDKKRDKKCEHDEMMSAKRKKK